MDVNESAVAKTYQSLSRFAYDLIAHGEQTHIFVIHLDQMRADGRGNGLETNGGKKEIVVTFN